MPRKDIDFESRYLERLEEDIDFLKKMATKSDKKLAENTSISKKALEQATRTNGRVDELWDKVFPKVIPKKDLPSLLRDPAFLRVLGYIAGTVLFVAAIVAAWQGVDITPLL